MFYTYPDTILRRIVSTASSVARGFFCVWGSIAPRAPFSSFFPSCHYLREHVLHDAAPPFC